MTFSPIRKPIIATAALALGQWFTTVETTRSGTVATDEQPSPRSLGKRKTEDTASFTLLMPEVRLGYPITDFLQVGLSFGALVALGDARPKVTQTPEATATDPQPKFDGKPIGFIPQPSAAPQSAIENPILFRSALYVRALF